jgi:hypothetical protein
MDFRKAVTDFTRRILGTKTPIAVPAVRKSLSDDPSQIKLAELRNAREVLYHNNKYPEHMPEDDGTLERKSVQRVLDAAREAFPINPETAMDGALHAYAYSAANGWSGDISAEHVKSIELLRTFLEAGPHVSADVQLRAAQAVETHRTAQRPADAVAAAATRVLDA